MKGFYESELEEALLGWLRELGYGYQFGPNLAPGEPKAERESFAESFLPERLRSALCRLNPALPPEALEDAFRKVARVSSPSLVQANRLFHRMLVEGADVEYLADGRIIYDKARLADFEHPDENDWLAVNQFAMIEGQWNRRPDVVIFLNGLPVAVFELKNPADENATVWTAYNQLQTYKQQIPSLFSFNEALVVSDGCGARMGSLTAGKEWFLPWKTIDGREPASENLLQLEVLVRGMFERERFLQLLRHFIVFEESDGGVLQKKIAGYHQFHAVNRAVETAVAASRPQGDRRCGVVWHTQGSGKSLTMVFFAGRIVLESAMENPTLVVLTDRNDLDGQLFGTFCRCAEVFRQAPVQAESRKHLRELLSVASGGVVFTTVQKFFPEEKGDRHPLLSDRRNIVVIADEAHRSQYDFIDGFARHLRDALPKASFIGFTGTPIELSDRNTRAVFGDYISIYDIKQAVDDGATVRIYYESRLAKLELPEAEKPRVDAEFEEVTEGEEVERKEKLKSKWAALEAVVGAETRLNLVARDLLSHFDRRQDTMEGKAMIVCMSRRICVELYNALISLRPEWHGAGDSEGALKIVMTGSASDPEGWQEHIRTKDRRDKLRDRLKKPDDPFKVVIVRDMWLTGFDAPCLHTMYLDKPMQGHGLMQAIARVNRVFRDKPGGLVVDYLGIADGLRRALADYIGSGGRGEAVFDQAEAVAAMLEKYEVCRDLFAGFDYGAWFSGKPAGRLALLPPAQNHILALPEGKTRLLSAVTALSRAFALSVPHEEAERIREEVAFFQTVRAGLAKLSAAGGRFQDDLDHAIRQIVSRAISSDEVVDIFEVAGLKKPDLSILSEEFLAEVQGLPYRNLAVEALQKLLKDEIRIRTRTNLIQARNFSEMLELAVRRYQNRAVETAQIIEELIGLAREIREAGQRGENLGLSDDEVAFYDALEVNDSAVKVLGDETLKTIARELVTAVRNNVAIDWTVRESVRAKMRAIVKRILRKYGYPPDKQDKATQTVLEQAELLCGEWA
ncbi:MAG: type I restriction endonuclease subunit R [bacterium]